VDYLQRRISLFEAAGIHPSGKEMNALSGAFGVSREKMEVYFHRIAGDVVSLFDELRERPAPIKSLVCACFQAPLRAYNDRETNDAIVNALKAGVFLMFIFPFPLRLSVESDENPIPESMSLEAFYRRVWKELVRRYRNLREQIGEDARHQLAIYRQRDFAKPSRIAVAPMASRYTLEIQKDGSKILQTLYAWTEGTDTQRMFPIGLVSRVETQDLLDAWISFLGQPLIHWAKKESFAISDYDCGPMWERYEPSEIGELTETL